MVSSGSSRRKVLLMVFVVLSKGFVVWGTPFNITNILAPYPDLHTFNHLLSRTNVAAVINGRQTITVLAVSEGGLSPILLQPLENIARILMVHVLLDYLSIPKLRDVRHDTTVTDLLQTTGLAESHQGFVVVNRSSTGLVMFRAAGQDRSSASASTLLEEVFKLPYNISVLRVSQLIIPPGMITRDQPSHAPMPSPAPAPSLHAPSPMPPRPSPSPSPAADESSPPPEPDAPPPGDEDDTPAPAPAPAPAVSNGNVGAAVAALALGCCLVNLMIGC